MAEADTPFMGTVAQESQGLAKAPSGRSTGGGLASPPLSPTGSKAPTGRVSGSFGANGHPAPLQLSSSGVSGNHAQMASPAAAAAQVASPTAGGAQLPSPTLGSPQASAGLASPKATQAAASPTPAGPTSPASAGRPELLTRNLSGRQSAGVPTPAPPAQQAPATPAATPAPAPTPAPAAEPAPAPATPAPADEQAPAPTISVKELSKQLASPAPDSGLVTKPSSTSSAGSGRPPTLGRSPSQAGMGATTFTSPSMNRRATSPGVAFMQTRSEHDKQNTTNAVQLLQLGAFKLQPLKDVIPYDELVKLRLEDGIDPTRKEDYLGAEDFQRVMGMDRDAYSKLPAWKRVDMKKRTFLF